MLNLVWVVIPVMLFGLFPILDSNATLARQFVIEKNPFESSFIDGTLVFTGTLKEKTGIGDSNILDFEIKRIWKGNVIENIEIKAYKYHNVIDHRWYFHEGQNYLIIANGGPINYEITYSKKFENAFYEIDQIANNDLTPKKTKNTILLDKLNNAKNMVFNPISFGNEIITLPISAVWVDTNNLQLVVAFSGMDSHEYYQSQLVRIVGNEIPLKIMYSQGLIYDIKTIEREPDADEPKILDELFQELENDCKENHSEYGYSSGEECIAKEKPIFDPRRQVLEYQLQPFIEKCDSIDGDWNYKFNNCETSKEMIEFSCEDRGGTILYVKRTNTINA